MIKISFGRVWIIALEQKTIKKGNVKCTNELSCETFLRCFDLVEFYG